MFMSESYMHIREDITEDDFLDITLKPKWRAKNDDQRVLSQMDISELKDTVPTARTKSMNNLNYDGDTDSIDEDEVTYNDVMKCSLCDIEFNFCIKYKESDVDSTDDSTEKKRRKKKYRPHRQEAYKKSFESRANKINFEEYKDWAHRMEEFDPAAERKWTLEYQYDERDDEDIPKLTKIVIGRGHKNEFPELNNIHLFDAVRGYENTEWRNVILHEKSQQNKSIRDTYSMIPLNNTCLFCFSERQQMITEAIRQGKDFSLPHQANPVVDKHIESCPAPLNDEKQGVHATITPVNEVKTPKKTRKHFWKRFTPKTFKKVTRKVIRNHSDHCDNKSSASSVIPEEQEQREQVDDDEDDDDEEFEVLLVESITEVVSSSVH